MSQSKAVWFVVADSQSARLLRSTPTQFGRQHVDEVERVQNSFTIGEHHRPARLGHAGQMASTGHEHEEKLAHFARELAPWLTRSLSKHGIATLTFFAPSHVLGALRQHAPRELAAHLAEQECEITGLDTAQLALHPRITALQAT